MSLRSRWLNFIMHITAAIAERKQDLVKYHAVKTFYDVLTVILLEGVLTIVSIPLYFSMRTETLSPENEFNVQYSIRKTLTYALFALLICILVIKTFVVGRLIVPQIQQVREVNNASMPYEQIYNVLIAPVDATMQQPAITDVSISDERGFTASGNAKPGSLVIITVANKDGDSFSATTQMYTAQAASDGAWHLSSSRMFNLGSGTYLFQAQSFDENLQKKSGASTAQEYTLKASADESLLNTLDTAANILLISFIGIGLLVVFLTF